MMLIYVIDDEEYILEDMADTIRQVADTADIKCFLRAAEALEAIKDGDRPDIIFSDIEMPGISGLELAGRLKTESPSTRLVFVTGFEEYAVKAFKLKAFGYLLKPVAAEDVRHELESIPGAEKPAEKLQVKCFGRFEVSFKGKPVIFMRRQSVELFALLVDRCGAVVDSSEISLALWEESDSCEGVKQRIRNLISDMKSTFDEIGMSGIILRKHRCIAVDTDYIDCDYYRLLSGDASAEKEYQGEYMSQFSWAEETNSRLYFHSRRGE